MAVAARQGGRVCRFTARKSDFTADLPMEPMHGTVGVAPRSARCGLAGPDAFGGNMDTPEMRAGTTCYLGVNVQGRCCARRRPRRQGEGNVGVAVECAMNTVLIVDWSRGADSVAAAGERSLRHVRGLGAAAGGCVPHRAARHGGVGVRLVRPRPLDAYQLSPAVESPLANVCDTNYTSIAKMPSGTCPRRHWGAAHGTDRRAHRRAERLGAGRDRQPAQRRGHQGRQRLLAGARGAPTSCGSSPRASSLPRPYPSGGATS